MVGNLREDSIGGLEPGLHARKQGAWQIASAGMIAVAAAWMLVVAKALPHDAFLNWLLALPLAGFWYCAVRSIREARYLIRSRRQRL